MTIVVFFLALLGFGVFLGYRILAAANTRIDYLIADCLAEVDVNAWEQDNGWTI